MVTGYDVLEGLRTFWFFLTTFDQVLFVMAGLAFIFMICWELANCCSRGSHKSSAGVALKDIKVDGPPQLIDESEPLPVRQVDKDRAHLLEAMVYSSDDDEITEARICLWDLLVDKHDIFANSLLPWQRLYQGLPEEAGSMVISVEPRINVALEQLAEIDEASPDRVLSELAAKDLAIVQAKAKVVYYHLWFMLWMAKLTRWLTNKSRAKARSHEYYSSARFMRRKFGFRVLPFLIFAGIALLFAFVIHPSGVLNVDASTGSFVAVFLLFVASLDYFLFACLLFFTYLPNRAVPTGERVGGVKDGFCLMIACYNSNRESLQRVIRAAKVRIEREAIFICDNSDKPTPISSSTRKLCLEEGVNYIYIPEGNKSHAFDWTIRHYLPEYFKFIMMTDDDVELPPNIEVPFKGILADETVGALQYPIRASSDPETGKRSPLVALQDHEYKLAGLVKLLQSQCGSVLTAHGAIALWKREPFLQIMRLHTTVFNGEDLQMGMILNRMEPLMRMKSVATEFVTTNPPRTLRDHKGEKGLYTQRVRSWDVCAHRTFFDFIAFTFTDILPPKYRLMLHLCNIANIWTIIQDYARPAIIVYFAIVAPLQLGWGYYRFFAIEYTLLILINYLKLSEHDDLRSPAYIVLIYPFYQMLGQYFRFVSLWYNFWSYHDAKNQKVRIDLENLGVREDLHDRPPMMVGLDKVAGVAGTSTKNWETIWMLDKMPALYGTIMDKLAGNLTRLQQEESAKSDPVAVIKPTPRGPNNLLQKGPSRRIVIDQDMHREPGLSPSPARMNGGDSRMQQEYRQMKQLLPPGEMIPEGTRIPGPQSLTPEFRSQAHRAGVIRTNPMEQEMLMVRLRQQSLRRNKDLEDEVRREQDRLGTLRRSSNHPNPQHAKPLPAPPVRFVLPPQPPPGQPQRPLRTSQGP
eukprot:TRINITY_DN10050_c0_g3_i1.p1 TRINITY_DN10050_c0_g3~~TRINITY_DN10050_c0_g3_i1.p1  ORF type:complete len:917 (+),score=396.54 TRINITY_DN10050_c0_g3_i1:186-2936(+)